MKKFFVGMAAVAAMITTPAAAQTVVASSGPYQIAALDDNETCVMGAATQSGVMLMIGISVNADALKIMVSNPEVKFTVGQEYDITIALDGRTVTWTGEAVTANGVMLVAGDAVDAFKGLTGATTVAIRAPSGRTIVSFDSDTNFDDGLKLTLLCAGKLAGK